MLESIFDLWAPGRLVLLRHDQAQRNPLFQWYPATNTRNISNGRCTKLYLTPLKRLRHLPMLWVSTTGFWNVLLHFLLLSLRYAGAVDNNRTIDDALGNSVTGPIFFPPGEPWQHQDCLGCPFQVDRARAFNRTWSVGITDPNRDVISVALSFKGSSGPLCVSAVALFFDRNSNLYFLYHPKPNTRREFYDSRGV